MGSREDLKKIKINKKIKKTNLEVYIHIIIYINLVTKLFFKFPPKKERDKIVNNPLHAKK